MTARIFVKLIVGVLGVLILALTVVHFLASQVAERTYTQTLTRELVEKGGMLSLMTGDMAAHGVERMAKETGARITLIGRGGQVLAESSADPQRMENHASRPEFMAALAGKVGSHTRVSHTTGVKYLYVAIPVTEGALRLAVPLADIDQQVNEIRRQLLASVALAFVPAIIVSAFFARYVSSKLAAIIAYAGKLASGDFRARLSQFGSDELGTLALQLNETGEKLQKMFEELQREHTQLEKLERIRKDFVINVSHELRTPLASIQGYTETLLDGALHDADHNVRFLSIIRQNAERLGRLTADLMTLSRIELKQTKFQLASYYANELVADCVDSMRPLAEKKNIQIRLERGPEDLEVFCDSEAVHQILGNLLDNAVKYTPVNGEIFVGARKAAEQQDYVEIWVRDTGIGIPAEDLPRLFERFYRVDKARSRELGGTGLGLAIVKHLARAQGGDVKVSSIPGSGSTFAFTLPSHDVGIGEDGEVQAELTTM